MENKAFTGCSEQMYDFFRDIAFHNEKAFFEANRQRYVRYVKEPMYALAQALLPDALAIDPEFNDRIASIVSRINRDTRFSKDKSPYRDRVWLGFKPRGVRTGEAFEVYAEFEWQEYGYGMGCYCAAPELMQALRSRMLAKPYEFLSLVEDEAFASRFALCGEEYKRPRFHEGPEALWPYLNRKSIAFCFSSPALSRTCGPEIEQEIREGFALLKPVYRFLMGLDERPDED